MNRKIDTPSSFKIDKYFALAFIATLIVHSLIWVFIENPELDIQLHDTYIVIPKTIFTTLIAIIFGFYAVSYYVFPKIFKKSLSEKLGKLHFWITFIGLILLFVPLHYIVMANVPRRYYSFNSSDIFKYHYMIYGLIKILILIVCLAQLLFIYNLIYSIFRKTKA